MNQNNKKLSSLNTSTSSDQPKPCVCCKENEIPCTSVVSSSLSQEASNIDTIESGYNASFSGNSTNFIPEQPATNQSCTESEFISTSELLSFSPYFGNTPTSLPEQLTGAERFVEDQFAPPTDTSISNFQQTRNSPSNKTPAFSESTPAFSPEQPAHTECSVEDESTTSDEPIFLFQQTKKLPTSESCDTNLSPGDTPIWVSEQSPTSNVSFPENQYASVSGTSTSLSQETKNPPRIEETSDVARMFPLMVNLLQKDNPRTPAPRERVTAICPDNMAKTFSSKNQATAKSPKQKGVISSKKLSPSKGQVAAERLRQKKGSLSSDKIISPSKKQAAALRSRKEKGTISYFQLTFPSKEQATAVIQSPTRHFSTKANLYTPAFSGSTLASIPEQGAHTDCPVDDESPTTSDEAMFLCQQTKKLPTSESYNTNLSTGDTSICVLEQRPSSNISFPQDQYASTSGLSTSLSQRRLDFQNIVPLNTTSFSGNFSLSVMEHPTSYFQSAIDDKDNFPATHEVLNREHIETFSSSFESLLPSKEQATAISQMQMTGSLSSYEQESFPEKQAITACPKQKGVFFSHIEISSLSEKQAISLNSNKETESICSFELTSPSKELKTGISQIQTIRSPSSSFERRFPAGKQATSVSSKQAGVVFFPIEITSPSKQQSTAETSRQSTMTISSFELTSPSKEQATDISQRQMAVSPSSFEKRSASTKQATSVRPNQKKWVFSFPFETSSPSKKQATVVSSGRVTRPISSFELTSPSKEQTTGLKQKQMAGIFSSFEQGTLPEKQETSVRPKQKKGPPTFSIETRSHSNEQETAIHLRQKTGTLTSVERTPSLQNKATVASPRHRTRTISAFIERTPTSKSKAKTMSSRKRAKTLSPTVIRMSTPRREVIDATPRRLTWPNKIPGEQDLKDVYNKMYIKSLNPELDLTTSQSEENTNFIQSQETSTKYSMIPQQQSRASFRHTPSRSSATQPSICTEETQRNVDRLENRLVLFNNFVCVQCFAEFSVQEELLNHESIHFNE